MEDLGVSLFGEAYRGRRVLVTGHTGFKGSWLTLWLQKLGANVSGVSLDPPTVPSHWRLLDLNAPDYRQDIRDAARVHALVEAVRPDIVFHLAAQPLVRHSYRSPLETWSTNVLGTANLLEACRLVDGVKAVVAITTDKVYANRDRSREYREDDRLGGHDPYSASKAACEILIESYRKSFFESVRWPLLASARAGNVIGGGDWSEDRLVPDLVRSLSARTRLVIRSPHATRPWQHVLECLAGYLALGKELLGGHREFADAWNFGPAPSDNRTVAELLTGLQRFWTELSWETTSDPQPHETALLHLDSTKAHTILRWQPVWNLEAALQATADWYRQFLATGAVASERQLERYVAAAQAARMSWVTA